MRKILSIFAVLWICSSSANAENCNDYPYTDGIVYEEIDGGFTIVSTASVLPFDRSPSSIKDAMEEAKLEAKAVISKFLSENIQNDEIITKLSMESRNKRGEVDGNQRAYFKEVLKKYSSNSKNILKGVIVIGDCFNEGAEVRVSVALKSSTVGAAFTASEVMTDREKLQQKSAKYKKNYLFDGNSGHSSTDQLDKFLSSPEARVKTTSAEVDSKIKLKPEIVKQADPTDAVAVIIGIQDYKRVPKAEFANNDARKFYDYAIRALGIRPERIKILLDDQADDVNIVKTFENWLPIQVNKDKTDVYVFFSGHGLPAPDGKSLYFLPHGVDKELLSRTAVGQNEIVAALSAAKPKSVTMFIDACYSGQTRGGDVLVANAKPVALKSDTNVYPPNFTVITASANDQISSSSPELKHGIFSFYLMKGMEGEADTNKDGKITAGEMQDYLSDKVSRQAMTLNRKQTTQLVGDAGRVLVGR
jgi:hypothetical protein